MTPDERQRQLRDTLKLLSTHPPFNEFMEEIDGAREQAIRDLCDGAGQGNTNAVLSFAGEIRSYNSIRDFVAEARAAKSQSPEDEPGG